MESTFIFSGFCIKKLIYMSESINKIKVKDITYDVEDSVARAGLDKVLLFESITWAELKSLKDNGNLAPGTKYRITDYVTTTTQSDTKSASNQFDIIVEALTENTLNELASACLHEGDTYFSSQGCNLEAWQLWYDLDNDTEKYEWADTENGKGVIYRMIDERWNDCPYDFKNIRFGNNSVGDYVYTFSYRIDGYNYDGTVDSRTRTKCHYNIIRRYTSDSRQLLNKIVFLNNSFDNNCNSNSFGNNCNSNSFGNSCFSNSFGNSCDFNSFGNKCRYNSFGNNCYYNSFGDSCNSNSFGDSCHSNIFGNNCQYNSFGSECGSNSFGSECGFNSFGNNCYANSFGGGCSSNSFGNNCNNNSFGNYFRYKVVNYNKTSITLNEEFYDDDSGSLVPIKHPDLSTQPSILPYKFMGQYVYEQLIPIAQGGESTYFPKLSVNNPIFLKFDVIGDSFISSHVMQEPMDTTEGYTIYLDVKEREFGKFIHIVYTSMPEEGDYYGYNNY